MLYAGGGMITTLRCSAGTPHCHRTLLRKQTLFRRGLGSRGVGEPLGDSICGLSFQTFSGSAFRGVKISWEQLHLTRCYGVSSCPTTFVHSSMVEFAGSAVVTLCRCKAQILNPTGSNSMPSYGTCFTLAAAPVMREGLGFSV